MTTNSYIVYKHTSPSGKVYIGITGQDPLRRWRNGLGYRENEYFFRAIVKYGWDNFKHDILLDGLTKEEACAAEIALIKTHDSTNREKGYNLSTGGDCSACGAVRSDEFKLHAREMNMGRLSPMKGKSHTEETKARISAALKGRPSPWKSVPHTEEWKAKVGASLRGHTTTEETRAKISASLKGRPNTWTKKSVMCIETWVLYDSATDAEKKTGIAKTHISAVCRADRNRRTAGGYHWKFINE